MNSISYDIAIIGSGAGGGTVAQELIPLAQKGKRIAVFEAGPRYPQEYFTQREIEMTDLYYYGGGWPTKDGAITLAAGKGVGGSTLVYTGVTLRLPESVYPEWNVEGISYEDLSPRYEELEQQIHVTLPGPDMDNDNNRLFQKGCAQLGWETKRIPLNIKGCQGMGFCNLGCSLGAKQGTFQVQLPKAEQAGIEIIPNCEITRIQEKKLSARISPPPPGTEGAWPEGDYEINADTIVVAAGSPATPGLLLNSGFGSRYPALGRYFTMHPAMTVYGIYPEAISNYQGFPKTFYTDKFSEKEHFFLETAFYYPFITTKHMGLWGDQLAHVMAKYHNLMAILVLNHDKALPDNRIKVKRNGQIVLDYKLSAESILSLCRAQQAAAQIFTAAGATEVVMPCSREKILPPGSAESFAGKIRPEFYKSISVPISSAHPQGGARMGSSRKDSVTNSWGQIHDEPWLYVADAGLFPQSSHVNPHLTVMALAHRVAQGIREEIS